MEREARGVRGYDGAQGGQLDVVAGRVGEGVGVSTTLGPAVWSSCPSTICFIQYDDAAHMSTCSVEHRVALASSCLPSVTNICGVRTRQVRLVLFVCFSPWRKSRSHPFTPLRRASVVQSGHANHGAKQSRQHMLQPGGTCLFVTSPTSNFALYRPCQPPLQRSWSCSPSC